MLKRKGISNSFWAEAINIAIYILNWPSTKAILNKTYIKLGMDINTRSINKSVWTLDVLLMLKFQSKKEKSLIKQRDEYLWQPQQ